MLSFTEENYLKCILKLSERGLPKVSTNAIAKDINSSPASVTDMLKRLAEKKMINYQRYQGVQLSELGRKEATQLIRRHRLWEVFLVDKLQFDWDEVHDIAEELEHVKSTKLVNKLDEFLGNPKFDPHGDPIPTATGKFTLRKQIQLNKLSQGAHVVVLGVQEHSKNFLNYLNSMEINIGTQIFIETVNDFDLSMRVVINKTKSQLLSNEVCQKLFVNEI